MHTSGREEGGDDNEEEQAQRAAIRQSQLSQPAPGGRNHGCPAGSVFDPARFHGESGESGGGDRITAMDPARHLLRPADSSNNLRRKGPCEENMKVSMKQKEEPARERIRKLLRKTAREGTQEPAKETVRDPRTLEGSCLKRCPSTASESL